jgi:hypothetical protein
MTMRHFLCPKQRNVNRKYLKNNGLTIITAKLKTGKKSKQIITHEEKMKTEVKNTLYRFITMRAPELLEKTQVDASFVQHPEIKSPSTTTYQSVFLASLNSASNGETKRTRLLNTANSFSNDAIKDRNELRASYGSKAFYDFAVWLTKNRTTITAGEIKQWTSKHNWPTVSRGVKEVDLWDNLFYQIITFRSNYVRDAIISMLVAEFFILHYNDAVGDEGIRKLAQARVIMPKLMFQGEENNKAADKRKKNDTTNILNTKELTKVNELLIIQNQKEQLEDIKKALIAIEKKYRIDLQNGVRNYDERYQKMVEEAYAVATATEVTHTNPVTGEVTTTIKYENLKLPDYNFEPMNELEYSIKQDPEYISRFVQVCLKTFLFTTFVEVYDYIDGKMKDLTGKQFERTPTSKRVANVNGVVVSTSNASSSYSKISAGYALKTMRSGNNKYLVLTFTSMQPGTDIISGEYNIAFNDAEETSISGSYVNAATEWVLGKLTLKIFNYPGHYFEAPEVGTFSISGTFLSTANRELILRPGTFNVNESHSPGLSDSFMDENGNSYSYTSGGSNLFATGIGKYDYEDAVTGSTGSTGSTDTDSGATTGDTSNDGGSDTSGSGAVIENVIDYIPSGYGIKRLGIADYRKVEQEICCYVPGEVSHIENVMAREYKEKSTRRLRRQEDTLTTSKEKETEKLTDSTSTERFEMNQEVSSVLAEQNSFAAGAEISWKGLVSGSAHADFAHNTSQETSDHQAVTSAQEVTERVLDRVVQKVKEERITKIIEEYEETNKHGYDNRKGDKHISGVYRWVDKIYRNQVINYGKRLMYEFMIPEPAVFHNMATEFKISEKDVEELIKPLDPRDMGAFALTNFQMVTEANYLHWAGIYNAEVEPKPDAEIVIGTSFGFEKEKEDGNRERWTKTENVKINDERYRATMGKAVMLAYFDGSPGEQHIASVCFGDKFIGTTGNLIGLLKYLTPNTGANMTNNGKLLNQLFDYQNIGSFKGEVPVSVQFLNYHIGTANVQIKCQLTPEAERQWQIETFNAIISAYEDRLKEYNDKLAELKASQVQKIKMNPMFYRQIENTILRKNCIEYMVSHDVLGKESLLTGTAALEDLHAQYDNVNLEAYAAKVKFFEQAFEWNLMSYYFYPFYWAHKSNWKALYNVDEVDDAVFRAFLQSGMARVIITVRPGFEEIVNWYMATGQVWNGGQVPTMNDPVFVSIVKELQEPTGVVEETWESRVPTSLTVIQAGTIGLNVEGLPCDKDCEDNLMFDSDGEPVLDDQGNQMSIIGQNPDSVQLGNITDELDTVSESIEKIKDDIEEIKTTLEGMSGGN